MNEDYLWDKSGEPDPQIQQLEEILGTLYKRFFSKQETILAQAREFAKQVAQKN